MTSKKNTNKALFSSVIALILCCSMLVGTTFAWFTDEVVTGMNTIAAGNLDVELLADGEQVKTDTPLFELPAPNLWEPGVVAYENLQVANVGTLALKYQMTLNFGNENNLNGHKLSEVLQVAVIDKIADGADRDTVLAAAEAAVAASGKDASLSNFYLTGELEAGKSSDEQTVVIFWAPNDNAVDNLYNANNGQVTSDGKPLHIEFGINLQATQKMSESDSFGPDYDSLASAWDGIVGEVPEVDENGVITLTTGAELAAFAASVNDGTSYSGKTVKLGADINLGGKAWAPIGACNSAAYFQGTFDGQGHTIYNLSVDKSSDGYQYSTAGLFGWIDAGAATIKNVNLENATVMGSHWVGALVGYMTGTVENCSVNNSTVMGFNVNNEANGDKVGGLVGYMNSGAGKLDGNTVKNTKISGYRDVAGLAGAVATTNTVTNNKVENVEITYSNAHVGKIVSTKTAVTVDETNTATNVTITRVIIAYTVAELNEALSALSGDALNTDAVLQNCDEPSGVVKIPGDYTGTLTLKDSAVASVQAAGAADLVIVGNVAVKATEEGMSAITGTKLNIAGNGNLTAIAEGNHAYGIGGDETAEINIKDVHIVDVKGGHVKAAITDNNYGKNEPEGGAAIGSGKDGAVITLNNVTIDNAQGGSKAAGIGARFHTGLTVNIQNSTIKNVEGGTSSAGIGGSRMTKHESGDTQNITINITNSRINAKGGDFAAGIGSGYNTYCSGVSPTPVISVTIDAASNITAQGGLLGAGIGTGHNALGFVGNIACDTSNVKAGSSEDPSWCCWGNPTTTAEDVGLGVLSIKNFPDKFGTYVNNADELAQKVAEGATNLYLADGVYENITGCKGKTLTINGSKNVILKVKNEGEDGCDYDFGPSGANLGDITFNGVTIDTTANTGNYKGYAYMKGTFNDCTFVGAYSLNNANDYAFNRCTFDFKNGYFWTWGANSVTFDGCTFNGNSKAILAHGYASTVITIKDCTFAATEKGYTGAGDNTAAVEIDPAGTNTYTINFIGENTVTSSYAGLTRVKDGSTGHTITGLN